MADTFCQLRSSNKSLEIGYFDSTCSGQAFDSVGLHTPSGCL